MSAFSTIELYRELDPRRRPTAERDYGVGWRFEREVFRLTWVETTGELIAVRLGHGPRNRTIRILTHEAGSAALRGEPMEVYVLAEIADRDEVEWLLEGWAYAVSRGDSLLWVLDRLEPRHEIPLPAPAMRRRRRPRVKIHVPFRTAAW